MRGRMKVLVFPYDKNPYQTLLYTAMRERYGDKVLIRYAWFLPVVGALHFPLEIAIRRLFGYRIIHIHWVAFYLRQHFPKHQVISWYITRYNFWWMKKLGYKIIWTVHDITPHQIETSDDIGISIRLANIADLKIVHSSFAISQMQDRGLNTYDTVVIPHGNYDGRYDSDITPYEARKSLGIPESKIVVLFFGIIKDYKGVDDLLQAYENIKMDNSVLVIAGSCKDDRLKVLLNRASEFEDVYVFDKYIEDSEVAKYFRAADLVCLPFKSITSSGSILLAVTFAKPLIAPRDGALQDLPNDIGYLYSVDDKSGLEASLAAAIDMNVNLELMGKVSRKYADSLSWSAIAKMTFDAYDSLGLKG